MRPVLPGASEGRDSADAEGGTLVSDYSKASRIEAVTVDGRDEGIEQGWEHGCTGSAGGGVAGPSPPTDRPGDPGADGNDRALAVALRRRLVERLAGAAGWDGLVTVSVSRAAVIESLSGREETAVWERTVRAAQASLGGPSGRPRFGRVVPLSPGEGPPDAWFAAVAEEVAGWGAAPVPDAPDLDGPFAAGPFAVADVLRLAASGWLAGGRVPGERVAGADVDVVDPGFRFPARGGDRDAAGAGVHPTLIVQGGRLVRLPAAGGAGGFLVRDSWRRPPRTDWRSLSLELPRGPDAGDLPVVTRVLLVGRQLLACGWTAQDGEPRARFGPTPAPAPSAWLRRAERALGGPIEDATGLPVRVPRLLIGSA